MNKILNSPLFSLLVLILILITVGVISYRNGTVSNMLQINTITDTEGVAVGDTLHILTYPEYFPDHIFDEFESQNNVVIVVDILETPTQLQQMVESETSYDIIIVNDYLVKPLSDAGLLMPIAHNRLSNFRFIDSRFRAIDYDYGNQHSIPFIWGTVGLTYNSHNVVGLPLSWERLFDPKRIEYLSGRISLLDDYRVTMGVLLLKLGYSPNTTNVDEIEIITERLLQLVPYVVLDNLSKIENDLLNEELYLSMMWSGSASMLSTSNRTLRYTLPSEGTIFWVENLAITSYSDNHHLAYLFIDYLLEPEVIAQISNSNFHANPVTYSRRYIHRHILNGPAYANPSLSSGVNMINHIGEDDTLYQRYWSVFTDSLEAYKEYTIQQQN